MLHEFCHSAGTYSDVLVTVDSEVVNLCGRME